MAESEVGDKIKQLNFERIALEKKLQNEPGDMSERATAEYERAYHRLLRELSQLFRRAQEDEHRVSLMLELMRIFENRLVYLHNFTVDPTSDNRMLASLVMNFLDELPRTNDLLAPLETTYYRAIASLYAGDPAGARAGFQAACESEESDEANDIKYKSYVILGNLSHEERNYEQAKDLHDKSLKYSQNDNVTAQALAFKALNSYALRDYDGAMTLFEEALSRFDKNAPFFNAYFHRNALLFCGLIWFERKDYSKAEPFYRKVIEAVEPNSYDHFDALSQLGKINYSRGDFGEAVRCFDTAIQTHKVSENEYLVDTYFWLAKSHLKRNEKDQAKRLLEKIAASDVKYDKRPQAVELLQRVS